jgi:hypothetical protein
LAVNWVVTTRTERFSEFERLLKLLAARFRRTDQLQSLLPKSLSAGALLDAMQADLERITDHEGYVTCDNPDVQVHTAPVALTLLPAPPTPELWQRQRSACLGIMDCFKRPSMVQLSSSMYHLLP